MNRETPAWAREMLRVAGGNNRFGDPNFRVTWSEALLDWVGGLWEDRDSEGQLIREVKELRRVPKYPWYAHRWIVERWNPPEMYGTPETWYRQTQEWGDEGNIPQLGPYPARGRYDFVSVFDLNGKFVQLIPSLLEEIIVAAIYKREHIATLGELQAAQMEKEKRWLQQSRDYLERPAFNANEFVSFASQRKRRAKMTPRLRKQIRTAREFITAP